MIKEAEQYIGGGPQSGGGGGGDVTGGASVADIGQAIYKEKVSGVLRFRGVAGQLVGDDVFAGIGYAVANSTGAQIPKGSYVSAIDTHPTYPEIYLVELTDFANEASRESRLGMVYAAIADGSTGYAFSSGLIAGLDTSTFSALDLLYGDPLNPGGVTNIPPGDETETAIGIVKFVDASNGIIETMIRGGGGATGPISHNDTTGKQGGTAGEYYHATQAEALAWHARQHGLGSTDDHTEATLSQLNALISDATLDDSSAARPPTSHASTHEDGGADEISVAGLSGVLADRQVADTVQIRVQNSTGSTITKGKAVYAFPPGITGAGQMDLADCRDLDKCSIIGVLSEDTLDGDFGWVTIAGPVRYFDTTSIGSPGIVYLKEGYPGELTLDTPTDGAYRVVVGVVPVISATLGSVGVNASTPSLTVEVTDTNGFSEAQKANTSLAFVDGTRTLTVSASTYPFHYYVLGNKYAHDTAQSIIIDDTEGEWAIYFDELGIQKIHAPSSAQLASIILNFTYVCSVYWNATDKKHELDIFEERHGISMSPKTHQYMHRTRGARWVSGFALGDFVADGDGSLDIHAQYSSTSGVFVDEDIDHNGAGFAVGDTVPVVYLLGSGLLRSGTQSGFAVLNAPAGRLYYNQLTGGNWQLTEATENYFVCYHTIGANGVTTKECVVMGQEQYANIAAARAAASTEIANIRVALQIRETIPIGTIIYQTSSGYTNAVQARIRTVSAGVNFVNWLETELASGSNPTSHANLTDLHKAASGEAWGHIDDQPQTIAGAKTFSSQIASTVATGTAPLAVISTTKNTNLNADKLDDQEGSYYLSRTNHSGTQAISTLDVGAIGDLAEKTALAANDVVWIEDSEASEAAKKAKASTIATYARTAPGLLTTVSGATHTVVLTDEVIHVTRTATGACTITIDSDNTVAGRVFTIVDAAQNAGTYNITIETEGSETINGETSGIIAGNGEAWTIYSDGSNYFVR